MEAIKIDQKDFLGAFYDLKYETIYMRAFPDKKEDKGMDASNFHFEGDDWERILENLKRINSADHPYGVFFVVNGGGHSDKDVQHIKAQFVEMDDDSFDVQEAKINSFELEPSIIVKTRKSLHCYWIMENGASKEEFREVQTKLINHFNGDKACKNESRVMRVPGFYHNKYEPVMVECIKFDPEIRYTQKKLSEALPDVTENKEKFSMNGRGNEGSRNKDLFSAACSMQEQGFPDEAIFAAIKKTNEQLTSPLCDNEVSIILSSALKYDKGVPKSKRENASFFVKNEKGICSFRHDLMAKYLIEKFNISKINKKLHIYDNGIYIQGEDILKGQMIKLEPTTKDAQRVEVYKYMEQSCDVPEKEESPPNFIPFKSNIYNLDTNEFIDYSEKYVFLNKFPYDYTPGKAREKESLRILETIGNIADGNSEVTRLIFEAIGACFYRVNKYRGAVMLYGESGSNGKSTLLNIIEQVVGFKNCSHLSLQNLSEKFMLIDVYGKAANIGDDIGDDYIPDSAIFKKLVTGEYVKAQNKYEKSVEFKSFAKLFFAANNLPKISDKSRAFMSRLLIVPLNHDFSADKNADHNLHSKNWDEDSMEFLLELSMSGLKRLIKQGGYTKPECVVEETRRYEEKNNVVIEFCSDLVLMDSEQEIEMILENKNMSIENIREKRLMEMLDKKATHSVYNDFKSWCSENGKTVTTHTKFTQALMSKYYWLGTKPSRCEGFTKVVRAFYIKRDLELVTA